MKNKRSSLMTNKWQASPEVIPQMSDRLLGKIFIICVEISALKAEIIAGFYRFFFGISLSLIDIFYIYVCDHL